MAGVRPMAGKGVTWQGVVTCYRVWGKVAGVGVCDKGWGHMTG